MILDNHLEIIENEFSVKAAPIHQKSNCDDQTGGKTGSLGEAEQAVLECNLGYRFIFAFSHENGCPIQQPVLILAGGLVYRFRNTVTDRTGWRRHHGFYDVCDPSPHTWQTAPCVRHPKLLYCYLGIAP